jgi:hypothetical protein
LIPSELTNSQALHPYYKLAYIKLAWGGEEEQMEQIAAGYPYAKNWKDDQRILKGKVSMSLSTRFNLVLMLFWHSLSLH